MEGYSRKREECHLLDLIPRHSRDWQLAKMAAAEETRHGPSEEKKLELSLGPPGGGDWTIQHNREHEPLSLGYFSPKSRVLKSPSPWQHQAKVLPFLHLQAMEESSQPCGNSAENTAVPTSTSAQKRTAPTPVVGWPPIRSFRKNIASGSSSKAPSDKEPSPKPAESSPRSPFVKINMDGIPIGRKVDLKAYDSYKKLAYAVDELFRGLLAAQRDPCIEGDVEGRNAIGGLLDGSGEYTLVYEDNEGDMMLVGDVPWHMFVSSVKRLRVLKSSEVPKLSRKKTGESFSLKGSLCGGNMR